MLLVFIFNTLYVWKMGENGILWCWENECNRQAEEDVSAAESIETCLWVKIIDNYRLSKLLLSIKVIDMYRLSISLLLIEIINKFRLSIRLLSIKVIDKHRFNI